MSCMPNPEISDVSAYLTVSILLIQNWILLSSFLFFISFSVLSLSGMVMFYLSSA